MHVWGGRLNPQLSRGLWCCCSVTVMSDSLWPHELQHTRFPCPSLSARVCSNSYPLSRWYNPSILSSVSLLLLASIFPSIRFFPNDICEGCSCLMSGDIQNYFIQEKEQVMNILHFLFSKSSTGLWRPLHILDLAYNSGVLLSLFIRCLKLLKRAR